MTVAQLLQAMKPTNRTGNEVRMEVHEAEAFAQRHRDARRQWIDRQVG
jgi:hypothetical protein